METKTQIDVAAILSAAAQSNLGILALLSIALSVLAYFFFASASEKAKVSIFILMFLGVVGFGTAMFKVAPQQVVIPTPPAEPNRTSIESNNNSPDRTTTQAETKLPESKLVRNDFSPDIHSEESVPIVDGTDIMIGLKMNKIENQLSRIASECKWGVDSENMAICVFSIIRDGVPATSVASFKNERLIKIEFISSFNWGAQINGLKESASGNKDQFERHCTQQALNQQRSILIGRFGAPISPPQQNTVDLSSKAYKESCEGRNYRFCQTSKSSETSLYVFRASKSTLLQFSWEKVTGQKSLETYGDRTSSADWGGCTYQQKFLAG